MPSRKRKDAAGQQSDPEIPLTDQPLTDQEYDLIFNCAFDVPRRFASH